MKVDIKRQIINELHSNARKTFPRRHVILKGLNDLYQADLIEMIPYARENKGYKYILAVVNAFSKRAYAEPLKSKSSKDVVPAMRKILNHKEVQPVNLQTDFGKEFYNRDFSNLMKEFNINHYSTFSTTKASICERLIRTLKSWLWKEFSYQGNYKWIDLLQQILLKYNTRRHRTIKMKPIDVNFKNEKNLLKTVYNNTKIINQKSKFKVNDNVRISKYREAFSKGYTPNWSNEIFKIKKVNYSNNPVTYILKDGKEETIKGCFYEPELLRTKYPKVQLIQKILRRKKNMVFVKYLGLDNTHNEWIKKSDLI